MAVIRASDSPGSSVPSLAPTAADVLGVYALLVALVGLRAVGLLPDVAALAYVPAVAAALLVDTFLYNAFGVTRSLYYPLVVFFAFPYAVAIAAGGRWVAARLRG